MEAKNGEGEGERMKINGLFKETRGFITLHVLKGKSISKYISEHI